LPELEEKAVEAFHRGITIPDQDKPEPGKSFSRKVAKRAKETFTS
jgi:hypothetical protein